MEAGEDTSLQPAIGWLAQNILESLQIDGMEAWIRRAGLLNDIEELKDKVETVDITVADKRVAGNNLLVPTLAGLKKLLYDAEEVVDELDHYRLEQLVTGVTWEGPESMAGADQADERLIADAGIPSSGGVKKRSPAWSEFDTVRDENGKPVEAKCKHCHRVLQCDPVKGTSVLLRHLKSTKCLKTRATTERPLYPCSSSGDVTEVIVGNLSTRKRMRTVKDSVQITAANTHPWNMTGFSSRINEVIRGVQKSLHHVNKVLHLHGSGSSSSLNHRQSTTSDQHLRTSSVLPRKVYGRVAEKNYIIKLITGNKSGNVAVLPIVGIGGVGKTTLAQLVYNDEGVKSRFHHRIWVWLSRNFDDVKVIREMLDFIPQETTEVPEERHEGINSFVRLQEILVRRANSKRLLFVLDDVWDDMTDGRWENLLKPINSGCANGSVILVTTRDVFVAKMTGTTEHTKLGALEHDEFRLLFKSHAFGDVNYMGDQNLSDIGQKIAEKLKGNPLAAESTGKLLKAKLNTDHWNKILKNEDWKSLQISGGIMTALKLSYDQLPYSSQQCFAYCSIFPEGYPFHGGELMLIWISQGFVKGNHSINILEEIELNYLTPLVNLGFLQQVERKESSTGNQTYYALCGLMHDFARIVSLTQCATIDGLQCNKIPPTIRYLSIVTGSEYRKDEHGNIPRNEKFEKNLRDTVTSVSKLRSLVLLGHYDSFFLQLFQDIFERAHNLHLLQMSARSTDFPNCGYDKVDGALPRVLSKLYHLRVLNVGSYTDPTIPDGINNLVSLQHLVVHSGVYSSIATFDSMTSFQESHGFKFQISSGFEMTELQSTDESVQHWMHIKTLEEAYEAVLRNNELSEKLLLSLEKTSADIGMELECVESRQDIKGLQISGYNGAVWLTRPDNSISTSFQTVPIHHCEEWKILPSLERFPFLTKLMLSNLEEIKEVLVPSLEELILVQMPKLERCSCASVEGMNSRLRALQIEDCEALKEFDLFEIDDKFEIDQRSWLPDLRKLTLRHCPHLKVVKPLRPSTTCSELLVRGVSLLPSMQGSSSGNLRIGRLGRSIDQYSDELRVLDDKILAFRNLTNLKSMTIGGCQNLTSFSLEGFSHLVSLKKLEIQMCEKLFSSDVIAEYIFGDVTAFPSLQSLSIDSCGITGEWLCLLLQHAPVLEELHLQDILAIQEGDSSPGEQDDTWTLLARDRLVHIPFNLISSLKKITIHDCPRLTFKWSEEGFSGCTTLQELKISGCPHLLSSLVHNDGNDDPANGRLLLPASLEGLDISDNYSVERLQPCFPSDLTSLKRLELRDSPDLESLQLRSCRALEILVIEDCKSLTELEGLESLGSLRHLHVYSCPGLGPCLERLFSMQGYELCSRLETFHVNEPSVFTTSSCMGLTSLQRLKLQHLVLTEEQGRALGLLTCLQELEFNNCYDLVDLPAGLHLPPSLQQLQIIYCHKLVDLHVELHTIPSLKRLKIQSCKGILRLPETGLPHSLEELEINNCSKELADHCSLLAATSKLRVKIDWEWLVL